ncbi:MAG: DnaJ C-terminal domain-containing protein [Micrococcaceae bacterium]
MASQDWLEKDYYKVLGVDKKATADEIKKSYRKLSRKYHPDLNSDDKTAEHKYKDITEAYTVLSDKNQRKEYDEMRAMGAGMPRFRQGPSTTGGSQQGFEDLFGGLFNNQAGSQRTTFTTTGGDIPNLNDLPNFENMFGGGFSPTGLRTEPRKGKDIKATSSISFAGAIRGTQIALRSSDGKVTNVRIPAGVKDGQKIKVRGKGQEGPAGKGDLIVTVKVKSHPIFTRDGNNIRITVPVSFNEAALGAKIQVPTLQGETVTLKIPAGTGSGKTLRVKGKGVASKKITGDMLVTLEITVPKTLNEEAKKAVEEFAQATKNDDPRAEMMSKAKL